MANEFNVRSISLPSSSHPSTLAVEERLNYLKTWEASSTSSSRSICVGLSGLEELYNSADALLNLASTQQVLSRHQHEKCLNSLLDGSDNVLDICSTSIDMILQIKEQVRALQYALRRRQGDSCTESGIDSYISFRKAMKKNVKKLMAGLKKDDNKIEASPLKAQDQNLAALIQVLREVDLKSILIFQALLSYLSMPISKARHSKWSFVSKMTQKERIACEENQENPNEFASVDASLSEGIDNENLQVARERLEALEISIEGLEKRLGSLLRRMITTRASLLNIISQ